MKLIGKKLFNWQERAQKAPRLLFSNLNFFIDVLQQIPFYLKFQLEITIVALSAEEKPKLCFIFSGIAR